MKPLKMGIIGSGYIAATMAATVEKMPQAEIYAVASRSKERAEGFASRFSIQKAYGSYEELVKDPEIQLVYIATPHSEHFENTMLCLEHGKHVLCEKAFAVTFSQAEKMISFAEEKKLLLTEAMWVRYMPMAQTLKEVLSSGVIGEPLTLTANLCYLIADKERMIKPELAGGALLDLGVYTLSFASLVFGDEVLDVQSGVIKTEAGVDSQNSIILSYSGGKMAILNSSFQVLSDRQGIVYGTKGFVVVENINNFEEIRVYNSARELVETYSRPEQISGFEYEVEDCVEAINNSRTECLKMPHKTTLSMMKIADGLIRQWGINYPFS